jgi:hypothetical protein
MKYKYYDSGQRLIAESDSPIQFNVARFPMWKTIAPVIENDEVTTKVTKKSKKKKDVVTEEATDEAVSDDDAPEKEEDDN